MAVYDPALLVSREPAIEKSQTPSTKSQTSTKFRKSNSQTKNVWILEIWISHLLGIWYL